MQEILYFIPTSLGILSYLYLQNSNNKKLKKRISKGDLLEKILFKNNE